MRVSVAQSRVTPGDPVVSSPPGSSVHGILQARVLDWVPFPFPGIYLSDPGIELRSPALQADSLLSESAGKWSESESCSVVSDFLRPHGLYSPWNTPGQNTGEGSLSLLQGIFPNQRSNPGLLHCRQIFCQLSHKGSPRILEWVAYPFSRDLPNSGIKLGSPALQADSLPTELLGKRTQIVWLFN